MEKKQRKTKDLKAQFDEAVAALKTQCKDAKFFDAQMDRILSLKGQLDVEPMRVHVSEKDVVKEHKGDTYYVCTTKQGAVYHTYGGFTLIADNRNASALHATITDMVEWLEDPEKYTDAAFPSFLSEKEREEGRTLTDEEKEEYRKEVYHIIDTDVQAKMHILNCPSWCFTDPVATYDIATTVVQTLQTMVDRAMEETLKEEDVEANEAFEDAARGAEEIGKLIEEEKGGGK